MKLAIKCIVFAVIVGIIIFVLNGIYTVTKSNFVNDWSDSFTIAGFYNEPKGSIDVLIFGTSTMNNGVQPAVLWNEQRFTAYNRSTEIQCPLAAYYLLTEALQYQQPRVVVLNADWLYMPPLGYPENLSSAMMHLALDYMKLSDVKIRAALDIISKSDKHNALDYIFPLYAYHSRKNITENDFDLSFVSRLHPLKGSSIHLEAASGVPFGMVEQAEGVYEISAINRDYVDRMIGLCQSKDIEVLLLTLPLYDWTWGHHKAVQQYADEMGVDFLDMNTPAVMNALALDPDTDFRNENHPAISGSSKISRYVASYLAENYALGRDYPEEVAVSFDASYAVYMAYSRIYDRIIALKSAVQLSDYIPRLADAEDSIVVISAMNEFYLNLTEQEKGALAALGLNTDFNADLYHYSYAAILDSGNVVFEQCLPDKIEYDYTSPEDISVSVISASALCGNTSSIVIDGTEYSMNMRGLNIVVYNKVVGRVVDSVNFNTNAGTNADRGDKDKQ